MKRIADAILTTIGLMAALSLPAVAQTFDLRTDWSDSQNPNAVWSYREGNNVLPHVAAWQGALGDFATAQPAWARTETGNTNLPSWFKSTAPLTIVHDWQNGDVVVHTTDGANGVGAGPANVDWTSPFSGQVDVSGSVWMGRDIGRANHWSLFVNNLLLASGDIASGDAFNRANPEILASGAPPSGLNNVVVNTGDIIKLQIAPTSAFGDYVGVNFTINTVRAVPEPGSLALFCGLGASGALFAIRRARQRRSLPQ